MTEATATTTAASEEEAADAGLEHILEVYIRASMEDVWRGITDGALTQRYFHETTIRSDWSPGARVEYLNPDGSIAVEGEVIEVDEPHRLSYTWHVLYNDVAATETRVTWELEQAGESVRLRMTHDRFPAGSVVYPQISEGWAPLLSSLKSLLETGEPIDYGTGDES